MDPLRWQTLSPLLDALLELEPDARAMRLATIRLDDPALADDLESLLAMEAEGDDFLSEPLMAVHNGVQSGMSVGPYELERLLGEGGMGQVWLARRADGLYQKRVALKLLRPGLADPNLRLRFTRERQILARLEHPHIARLLDAGISSDQQPYLALEYVEGEPITDWCRAHTPSIEDRLRLFLQICDAVSHAHTNLIVHRDLKPSNILVTPLDEVRLLDFGIAKLLDSGEQAPDNTRTGLRTFTLHYAAPEQILGEPVTTMTDVYSLGVVLYELLTDRKPYQLKRPSDAQWEDAILNSDPVRPSIAIQRNGADTPALEGAMLKRRLRALAGDLDNITLRTLAKRPEQRYPSVEALALDLHRHLDGKPVLARPQSLAYRARKFLARQRWALSTAVLVSAVLVSALGIISWQAREAVNESARAQAMQDFIVGLFENAGSAPTGTPLDVRTLLDSGVQRGERELARQPLAHAELLGLIARLRLGLGDYDQALALLQRQAQLVAPLDNVPANLQLQAAIDIGRVQQLIGQPGTCITAMQPQKSTAGQEQRRGAALAASYYTQLGRCHRAVGEGDAARLMFLRSLALRRGSTRDDAGIVENLVDLAGLQADSGHAARALGETQAALSLLRSSVGEEHPLEVSLLRSLCSLQRQQDDMVSAERDCELALSLSQDLQGPHHRDTIDARRQLAALHVDQGLFKQAQGEFEDALAWMRERLGDRNSDVARAYNSLGIVAWELGDTDAALANLTEAVEIWRESGRPSQLADGLFNQALVLHSVNRPEAALPLLDESLALRSKAFGPEHGLVGDTLRLIGEVDAMLGHDTRALDALQRAADITRGDYGTKHSHTRRAELSLARYQSVHGQPGALTRLDVLAGLPLTDIELRKVAWLAQAYAAEARCLRGERNAMLSSLKQLDADVRAAQPEGGVVVRDIERIARHCAQAGATSPPSQ
ncbi:serine/threonine-protein kinase [Luteimonas sp. RIT-PG2_3]